MEIKLRYILVSFVKEMASLNHHAGEGGCSGKDCLQFGFEVSNDTERQEVNGFATKYANLLEIAPESTDSFRVFRIWRADLTRIPQDLADLILEFTSASSDGKGIDESKRTTVDTVVKPTPEFYAWLSSHRNLKELRLTFKNDEETPSFTELMNVIGHFDGLETLVLEDFPFNSGQSAEELARALEHLPYLKTFEIPGRGLDDSGLTALAPSINKLTRLDLLNLGGSRLTAESLKLIIPTFERITRIKMDDAGDSDLWAEIFPLMSNVTRLTHVNFSEDGLIGETLVGFLSHLPNLVDLNLEHNDIDDNGFRTLKPILQSLTRIESLSLRDNEINDFGAYLSLIDSYGGYPNLKTFRPKYSPELDEEQQSGVARHYATVFARTPHLETVDLSELTLTPEILAILMPQLIRLPIKDLTLHLDKESDIRDLVSHLPYLRSLKISSVKTEFQGDYFLDSLQRLPLLESLSFKSLALTRETNLRLADIIRGLTHLRSLEIRDCWFDLGTFFGQMGSNANLTRLALIGAGLDKKTMPRVLPLLNQLPNLEELDFSGSIFDNTSALLLEVLVRGLPRLTKIHLNYVGKLDELEDHLHAINPELRVII